MVGLWTVGIFDDRFVSVAEESDGCDKALARWTRGSWATSKDTKSCALIGNAHR